MQFRQFVDDDLGCASYLIGDESSGEAVVVDPAYAIEHYLEEAEKRHVRDHARARDAHARRPRLRTRAVRARARRSRPRAPRRGARVPARAARGRAGDLARRREIRVLHTPGHRPEHCCFVVVDRSRGDEPWLVITGDSLLIGDAARPDLASRGDRGRDRPLREPAEAARAPRRRRALPRPRRRLALRRRA